MQVFINVNNFLNLDNDIFIHFWGSTELSKIVKDKMASLNTVVVK